MPPVLFSIPETLASVLTTELNSLANNAAAVSGVQTTDRRLYADLELVVTFGVAPTAQSLIEVYVARRLDGTNFEDYTSGASGAGPANGFLGGFPLRAVTTAQRIVLPQVTLPANDYRWILVNRSGQTMAASGNTLKVSRYTEEA